MSTTGYYKVSQPLLVSVSWRDEAAASHAASCGHEKRPHHLHESPLSWKRSFFSAQGWWEDHADRGEPPPKPPRTAARWREAGRRPFRLSRRGGVLHVSVWHCSWSWRPAPVPRRKKHPEKAPLMTAPQSVPSVHCSSSVPFGEQGRFQSPSIW